MTIYHVIGLVLATVSIILSFYTIINRQNANFKAEINEKFNEVDKKFEQVNHNSILGFERVTTQFNTMALQVNTMLEGDIRELRTRLNKLESGQDDWTKELRERTHNLSGAVDKLGYEIELLKIKCKELK